MKKILIIIAICLLNAIPALAEKNDCSGMKKLSKESNKIISSDGNPGIII